MVLILDLKFGSKSVIVLHIDRENRLKCNTTTGGHLAISSPECSTSPFLVLGQSMLANSTTCGRTQDICPICPALLDDSWIPQKLFPQWQVVHSSKHSEIRTRRVMVFGRHRFLKGRQSQQHPCQAGQSQPRWDHCRILGRKMVLPG